MGLDDESSPSLFCPTGNNLIQYASIGYARRAIRLSRKMQVLACNIGFRHYIMRSYRNKQANNKQRSFTMAKFKVVYWERTSVEREIEAETDAEARQKMREMVANGDVDASYAELDDSGVDAEKIAD
jgi:hypothetical protein